ncbi:hypothetical protein GGF43_002408 [Coemansia sp. RSA 2618]|nr:hypothetical protein GGF43_002408 [Coemansia sp. RSA 2618]
MRRKLSLLTTAQLHDESTLVFEQITNHPAYQRSTHLSIYINMPTHELQTTMLIRRSLGEGKRVYVPRCDGRVMRMIELREGELDEMPVNRWGIREPRGEREAVDPRALEFVVVPGVAFDRDGNRCGHGMGYYDRYLEQTGAFTCAVCLNDQVVDSVPTDSRDRKPDLILSPSGILFEKQ